MGLRRIVYPDAAESVLDIFAGDRRARLEALGLFEIRPGYPEGAEDYLARIGDAEAVLLGGTSPVPLAALERMLKLEIISFCGVGAGTFVDLEGAARLGITVCNVPDATVDTVAEFTLALLLATARHLCALDRGIRAGEWVQSLPGSQLGGKKLGLIGLGPIGGRFAEMARALGMEVSAWTRHPSDERARRHGVVFASLAQIIEESDVLSLHLALTPETEGLIGAAELERTKPGVILINAARGALVDEVALVAGLRSGQIAAAGLDVFAEEPLPAGHPLLAMENVVLSPHVAWNTPEASERLFDGAIGNLERYFRGEPANVLAAPDK